MSYKCKECDAEFDSERSLHTHIKKHNMYLGDYYVKNYPRRNKLTGDLIQFKNKEQYFNTDFSTRAQLAKWCEQSEPKEVCQYISDVLRKRTIDKGWKHAPFHIELQKEKLPTIDVYRKHFDSYKNACIQAKVKPLFTKKLSEKFFKTFDVNVFVDTREQKPLSFKKSEMVKLDFGDYTLSGDDFTNTFVDRKSATDFIGTFGSGFDRFRREMNRCVDTDSYMYIVVEKSIKKIYKDYFPGKKITTLNWAFSNLVKLQHEFPRNCQFVFTENREQSELIIPKLLALGKELWETDIQYYIDCQDVLGER